MTSRCRYSSLRPTRTTPNGSRSVAGSRPAIQPMPSRGSASGRCTTSNMFEVEVTRRRCRGTAPRTRRQSATGSRSLLGREVVGADRSGSICGRRDALSRDRARQLTRGRLLQTARANRPVVAARRRAGDDQPGRRCRTCAVRRHAAPDHTRSAACVAVRRVEKVRQPRRTRGRRPASRERRATLHGNARTADRAPSGSSKRIESLSPPSARTRPASNGECSTMRAGGIERSAAPAAMFVATATA